MESLSKADESFPTPPPYYVQGPEGRINHMESFFSPVQPLSGSAQTSSPLSVPAPPPPTPRLTFVSHETQLRRSPALTTCYACETQVITQVTYRVGSHVWLMCLVLVLFGLVLGCCLVPFFLKHFKDAYHTCPLCRRVLHVHRKTCGA